MSNKKKAHVYAGILEYLEDYDPDLHNIIRSLCLDYLFNLKGKPGITFLWPKDEEFRKKIFDLAESGDVDKAFEASDMIAALVIPDNLKSPDDFKAKSDDIPNALNRTIEVDVKGSSINNVKFTSGAIAVIDKKFTSASRKNNLNVYILEKGEIPVEGKLAQGKYIKRTSKKPTKGEEASGGFDISGMEAQKIRQDIAINVENAYFADHTYGTKGSRTARGGTEESRTSAIRDAYLEATLSLINFILVNMSDETIASVFVGRMLPIISFTKVDFYLFVEPHRTSGEYLIPTEIVKQWNDKKHTLSFSVQEVIDRVYRYLKDAGKSKGAPAVLSQEGRKRILSAADEIRSRIQIEPQPRKLADIICEAYQKVSQSNKIGGVDNIWPHELSDLYASELYRKILEDEMRYVVWWHFEKLESNFSRQQFLNILQLISDYQKRDSDPNSQRSMLKMMNSCLKVLIAPTDRINDIKVFVQSTFFMYIPFDNQQIEDLPFEHSIKRPNVDDLAEIWNVHKLVARRVSKLINMEVPSDDNNHETIKVLERLSKQDPTKLDPSVKKMLEDLRARQQA